MLNKLKNIKEAILNFLFPDFCIICERQFTSLCTDCIKKLESRDAEINSWSFAMLSYKDENVKKVIKSLKYNNNVNITKSICVSFASYIHEKLLGSIYENSDVIKNIYLIPIPIHLNRYKERGYNQAELITADTVTHLKNLLPEMNINMQNILERNHATNNLYKKDNIDARLHEVKNSIEVNNEEGKLNPYNSYCILIDDVTTTGATFYEARRALIGTGIKQNNIFAFALAN